MKHAAVQLGVALAVLVALLLAYGAWYAFVAHETARDASLAASIAAEGNAATRAAAAERTLAQLGPRETGIESRFVPVPGVVPFLEDVQAVGSREGAVVTVGSVSEQDSPRAHLAIALTISGSFDAVMRTMGVLENGPYDIEAGQSSLAASGSSVWNATMMLSVGTVATAASSSTPPFFPKPSAPPSNPVSPGVPAGAAGPGASRAAPASPASVSSHPQPSA